MGHIQFALFALFFGEHGMCEPSSWVLQPRAPVRDALPLGQLGLDVRARLGLGLDLLDLLMHTFDTLMLTPPTRFKS